MNAEAATTATSIETATGRTEKKLCIRNEVFICELYCCGFEARLGSTDETNSQVFNYEKVQLCV